MFQEHVTQSKTHETVVKSTGVCVLITKLSFLDLLFVRFPLHVPFALSTIWQKILKRDKLSVSEFCCFLSFETDLKGDNVSVYQKAEKNL